MGPSLDSAAVGTSPTRQRPADRVGRIHLRRAVLSLLVLRGTVAAPVPGHAVSPALLPAAVTQASAGEGLLTNWWVAHGFAALTLCLAGVLVWRSSRTRRAAARWTTYLTSLALTSGTVIAAMLTALLYVNAASGFVPSLTALQALFDTGAGSAVTTAPPVPAPVCPGCPAAHPRRPQPLPPGERITAGAPGYPTTGAPSGPPSAGGTGPGLAAAGVPARPGAGRADRDDRCVPARRLRATGRGWRPLSRRLPRPRLSRRLQQLDDQRGRRRRRWTRCRPTATRNR